MFKKPFTIKNTATLKANDKKCLIQQLKVAFQSDLIDSLLSQKDTIQKVTNIISKYGNATNQEFYVYLKDNNPLFFTDTSTNKLYPTLFSLWICPCLVPTVITPQEVIKYLSNGSDLMMPGIIRNHPFLNKQNHSLHIVPNTICSVTLDNFNVPMAVGVSLMNISLYEQDKKSGKAMSILHVYGDHLCTKWNKLQTFESVDSINETHYSYNINKNPTLFVSDGKVACADNEVDSIFYNNTNNVMEDIDINTLHLNAGEDIYGTQSNDSNDTLLNTEKMDSIRISGQDKNAHNQIERITNMSSLHSADILEYKENADTINTNNICNRSENTDAPIEIADNMLIKLFCKGLLDLKNENVKLPIIVSTFYKKYMLDYANSLGINIELKKTSYSKLSTFLSYMSNKENIIRIEDMGKGVEAIIKINYEHNLFKNPEYEFNMPKNNSRMDPDRVEIFELLKPPVTFKVLYDSLNIPFNKHITMTNNEAREFIIHYIHSQQLDTHRKGHVRLDPYLAECLLTKKEYFTELKWEDLINRYLGRFHPCYSILAPGFLEPQLNNGCVPKIQFKLERRSGNKLCTTIHNLAAFKLDLKQISHEVSTLCAASTAIMDYATTTNAVITSNIKPNCNSYVYVQGDNIVKIANFLQNKYGISQKYFEGVPKSSKGAKNKGKSNVCKN